MRVRPESIGFTVLLGALAALPPLSIDMGLPAFPALERHFGASALGAGLTLSVFMAGFSVSQLVLGPLSDRIGRRPVLLGGLALYGLAGLLCTAAPTIAVLIACRVVQGACAASGTVMAFAMVRDLLTGAAARTKLSYVTMVLSVAPVIAPTLGGWLLLLGGWRGIYGFLGGGGLLLLAVVAACVTETRPLPVRRVGVLNNFRLMLGHRTAMAYAVVNALSFGSIFAYVSGSSLLLMSAFHLSAQVYGLLFAITAGGIMVGTWVNGHLSVSGVPPRRPLALALVLALASAVALMLVIVVGPFTLATLVPLLVVHMFCRGISAPSAAYATLEPMGAIAGLASAVLGFMQMATGALSSAAVAVLFPVFGPMAMTLIMMLCAGGALVAFWVAGLPSAAPAGAD